MDVDPIWFGPRLKELRESAGFSQQELADLAGLTRAGISSLELGRTRPYWDTVIALCKALKVSCDIFMQQPEEREQAGPGRPPKAKKPGPEKPTKPKVKGRKQEEE